MSALEYNLVCAGGDGLKRKIEKPQLRRTPVPSCRKLTARPQIKDDQVKVKLEEAMQSLSSPNLRKFNRKRAQTVAEITPSKRRVPAEVRLPAERVAAKPRKEDASRRVYQQLLLNAWRRRRVQVATLTDSSRRLQTQVDQLQMQVDLLQKLRESESQRRLETASETESLRSEKNNLTERVEKLQKRNVDTEKNVNDLQQRIEEINVNYVNLKNELLHTKTELSSYELLLQKECRSRELLEEEKQGLLEKIDEYKNTSTDQIETIRRLEKDLDAVEKNLDNVNLNNSNLEESKTEIEMKLEREQNNRDELEQQLIKSRLREEKLQRKLHELKKNVHLLNEAKKQMLQENLTLKRMLYELEQVLTEERSKTWWRSAGKILLNTLHNAAYVMLPAFPRKIGSYPTAETISEENNTSI